MTTPGDDRPNAAEGRSADQTVQHDLLNQLFIIQGRTEAVLLELEAAHPLRADLLEVHRACGRAVEIVRAWRTRRERPGS